MNDMMFRKETFLGLFLLPLAASSAFADVAPQSIQAFVANSQLRAVVLQTEALALNAEILPLRQELEEMWAEVQDGSPRARAYARSVREDRDGGQYVRVKNELQEIVGALRQARAELSRRSAYLYGECGGEAKEDTRLALRQVEASDRYVLGVLQAALQAQSVFVGVTNAIYPTRRSYRQRQNAPSPAGSSTQSTGSTESVEPTEPAAEAIEAVESPESEGSTSSVEITDSVETTEPAAGSIESVESTEESAGSVETTESLESGSPEVE